LIGLLNKFKFKYRCGQVK